MVETFSDVCHKGAYDGSLSLAPPKERGGDEE